MENTTKTFDCVAFKNELHNNLYKKSGAHNFNEYIQYINSIYSDTQLKTAKCGESGQLDNEIDRQRCFL